MKVTVSISRALPERERFDAEQMALVPLVHQLEAFRQAYADYRVCQRDGRMAQRFMAACDRLARIAAETFE